jgi:hypothetical protein
MSSNASLADTARQLETIFSLSPGPHELRVIGRHFHISLDGKRLERVLLSGNGDPAAFSIGCPRSVGEAIRDIQEHFRDQEAHNVFIVLNRCSDNFTLEYRRQKIGDTWIPKSTSILTKARDVQAIVALAIDLDRRKETEEEALAKLCASPEELAKLDSVRLDVLRFLDGYGLKPSYQIASGNGFQAVYFFDSSPESIGEAQASVKAILRGLHAKFSSCCDIDVKLSDPSRVVRLAGILNRKPSRKEVPSEGRFHRMAKLLEAAPVCCSFSSILSLAASLSPEEKEKPTGEGDCHSISLPASQERPLATAPQQTQTGWREEVVAALEGQWQAFYEAHGISGIQQDASGWMRGKTEGHHDHSRGGFAFRGENGYFHDFYSGCQGWPQDFLQAEGMEEWQAWQSLAEFADVTPHSRCKHCQQEIFWKDRKPYSDSGCRVQHRCLDHQRQEQQKETHTGEGHMDEQQQQAQKPYHEWLRAKQQRDMQRIPGQLLGWPLAGFQQLASRIDGLQAGLYIVGGESQSGKTAFAVSLSLSILLANKDVTLLYFSLDDPREYISNRLLAARSLIPMNRLQIPAALAEPEKAMLEQAYDKLVGWSSEGRLHVWDLAEVSRAEALESRVAAVQGPKVVVVDGLYNFDVAGGGGVREASIERANFLKRLADSHFLPVIATAEVRKRAAGQEERKLSIHDLMESGKFAYNANVVWLLEASQTSPEQKQPSEGDSDETLSVTLHYAKNKLSWFSGSQKLSLHRRKSLMLEVAEGQGKGNPW